MSDPVAGSRRGARALQDPHLPDAPVARSQGEAVGIVARSDVPRARIDDPPVTPWG